MSLESDVYFIGIDGGGTKTKCVIVDQFNNVLGETIEGSSNWNSVGKQKAKEHIVLAIHKVIEISKIDKSKIAAICVGMAGVDRPDDKKTVNEWLIEELPNANHIIVNDGVVALASGTGGEKHGIVIISGTGSIALGFNKDKGDIQKRASGWGPLLGELGSGYYIGNDALIAVCRAHDGRGEKTIMTEKVLKKLELNDVTEIISWKYKDISWERTASLSSIVYEAYKEGDKIAENIINKHTEGLLESILSVKRQLEFKDDEEFPIVFAGGNLTHEGSILASKLKERINESIPKAVIRFPIEPCKGASLLAIKSIQK